MLRKRTDVSCAGNSLRQYRWGRKKRGEEVYTQRKTTDQYESVATLMCCGLCLTSLQPVVCRPSCCSVAQSLLCSYLMSSPGFIKLSVPWPIHSPHAVLRKAKATNQTHEMSTLKLKFINICNSLVLRKNKA